ncbi:hypothetical protein DY000_02049153 [Brassica cretica]|uniref:Uncharacterized protein n=1 Tax=Brassica cretica TaxID=69181 RepID=A0ABQ7EV98_BRACR|nr:hypothetical protein DY000_02049153 [Brassica cretica]
MEMAAMTTMKGGESSGLKLGFWKTGLHRWICAAEEAERGRHSGGGSAEEEVGAKELDYSEGKDQGLIAITE